ncbi:MAG: DUF3990 domain-containing protein [Erysipelotrichaceae bacterium]|nr:DUF3990 domain-containing protein [Erysipelotrichaceae bacterium]
MNTIRLYHTGFQIIEKPDRRAGRKNADFGQGFYLSDDVEFSRRWARQRTGMTTYLNEYELDPDGLKIRKFVRDCEWFDYILNNRAGRPDPLADYDVIIGPIAPDTIFETWGIITGGVLDREESLELLKIGKAYEQTVIKTEKGLASLRFLGADVITAEETNTYLEILRQEEERFQEAFTKRVETMMEADDENR